MVEITQIHRGAIEPLFRDIEETLIWSCLEGEMGRAWGDDAYHPTCARIITGDFAFFSGDSSSYGAKELVAQLPKECARLIMTPVGDGWAELIESVYGQDVHKGRRYAIRKEPGVFNKNQLRKNVESLPGKYRMAPISRELYPVLMGQEWSGDFCSCFEGWEDYRKRGIGYVVLDGGRPVSGASSYTVYSGGIEIEIATLAEYRRQGLALACASKLILACLERGLYPSWDAANPTSARLAEKLGYHRGEPYEVYFWGFGKSDD